MRALYPYLMRMRYQAGWVVLGTLLALVTLGSSIGLLTLSGWFIAATALAGATLAGSQAFNFYTPGAGVRGFAIFRTLGRYAERVVSHEATFRLITEIRVWFYRRLEPLEPARLAALGSGQLLSRLVGDVAALDTLFLRVVSPTIVAGISIGLVGLFLSVYAPELGILAICTLLATGFVIPGLGFLMGRRPGASQVKLVARLRSELLAALKGMPDLRIYGGFATTRQRLERLDHALLSAQARMGAISALTASLMMFLSALALILILVPALNLFHLGKLEPAQIVMVVFCLFAAFEAVLPLPQAYQFMGKTLAATGRINEVAQASPAITYPDRGVVPLTPGAIRFHEVSLCYGRASPALDRLSMEIGAGERVIIQGHSGSGKSSLINLLARFWAPDCGEIELSGQPIEAYDESTLRAQLSVMAQPVQLFAGTLRDNLKLAAPDADDQELLDVLVPLGLPAELDGQGLEYWIGESGCRLSGGQQKRLALARALLREAPVLILDEPTEGLDPERVESVLGMIDRATEGKTLLLITHHRQPPRWADRVVTLDRGRLVENNLS